MNSVINCNCCKNLKMKNKYNKNVKIKIVIKFGLRKMRGISRLPEKLLASKQGLRCAGFVSYHKSCYIYNNDKVYKRDSHKSRSCLYMQYQPSYGSIWGRKSAEKLNFSLPSHFETHKLLLHLNSDFFHKRRSALGSRKLMEWWDHLWSWIPECVIGELHLEGWMGGKGRITLLELVASVWNVYRVLKKVEFSKKKKRQWWCSVRHKWEGYSVSHN